MDSYPESKRTYILNNAEQCRYFKNTMFFTKQENGEKELRRWLIYSPSKGTVFCFFCTLMLSQQDCFSKEEGFNNWKKADEKMKAHETSRAHRDSVLKLNLRCKGSCHVDKNLESQMHKDSLYWTEVLCRVVAVTKFLAERGLAFRGSEENIGSKNNGNFLGIIELIAQFDPFLRDHLKNTGNPGSGRQSYLSPKIYEEFVILMAKSVKAHIVSEVKAAKYFSISVDSTPDLAHVDQLAVIVRYVVAGRPVERFLTFLQPGSHKAEVLTTTLLQFLDNEGINFEDCRGQSYDNASNMSG
ncbi:uncharacterized protein LOC115212883, partial [Argonauta hians]